LDKTKIRIDWYLVSTLMVLLLFFWSCEETSIDPCDDTVKPEKAVTLKVIGHILTLNNYPVVGQSIYIETYKAPCGADSKGFFKFEGVTNNNGSFEGSMVGYNLRNSEDKVSVQAVAPELENFFEQNFAGELFNYNDFSSVSMKVMRKMER